MTEEALLTISAAARLAGGKKATLRAWEPRGLLSLARIGSGRRLCSNPQVREAETVLPVGPPKTRLARNSKCAFLEKDCPAVSCDPWTIHSLRLLLPGHQCEEALPLLRSFTPAPMIFPRRRTNRETGEVMVPSYFLRVDFADPADAALLSLGDVAASLQRFPWTFLPGLRVNRVDLASDHLASFDPTGVCDRIAELHLPYCRPYRDLEADEPWLTIYHNGGQSARPPGVVVIHYPRLQSLLHAHPEAGPAAREYTKPRVRQEVRFRGQGLRRRVGDGAMTPEVVFGSFAALVRFAERRLKPVFQSGMLSPPPRDLPGEAALAVATRRPAPGVCTSFPDTFDLLAEAFSPSPESN